jgi:N-acetylglucosaminylphosphatidylinositol deacetylase
MDLVWLLQQSKYALLALNVGIFVWLMATMRRRRGEAAAAGEEEKEGPSEVLLVVAHPDDEAMFFGPLLTRLRGRKVHLLCLSNGGSALREKEFAHSCGRLGAASWSVAQFADGFDQVWPPEAVAEAVARQVRRLGRGRLRSVLTFDLGGVSGHPNHIAACRGCVHWQRQAAQDASEPIPNVLVLDSVGLWRKYWGLLEALVTAASTDSDGCFVQLNPLEAWQRMENSYSSQFVWYRRLSTLFSRYTYVNTFTLLA